MNSEIVSIKRFSTIFLAIVLFTGAIAAISSSSSFIRSAQAQPSYYSYDGGMDYNNNYYKSEKDNSKKTVNLSKIKCINDNININGVNAGNISIGNKGQLVPEEGDWHTNAFGDGYSETNNGYDKKNREFGCIINNNNTNINFGGNQTIPPEEPTGTLNITKVVECRETGTSPIPDTLCQELLPLITEDQFLFQVEGNNLNPSSQFPGSEAGTDVTLGAGNYVVLETLDEAGITELNNFRTSHPAIDILFFNAVFTEDCTETFGIPFPNAEATGTIAAGESQTCNVRNVLEIIF